VKAERARTCCLCRSEDVFFLDAIAHSNAT
jgi:hypothetical protein